MWSRLLGPRHDFPEVGEWGEGGVDGLQPKAMAAEAREGNVFHALSDEFL